MDRLEKEQYKDRIIDCYSRDFAVRDMKFTMMGMMLDSRLLKKRFYDFGVKSFFIYGTGPLGIQLLNNSRSYAEFKGFIDDSGSYYRNYGYGWGYDYFAERVYKPKEIQQMVGNATILLADYEDLDEMRDTILPYVKREQIIYLNEFLYGGVRDDIYR